MEDLFGNEIESMEPAKKSRSPYIAYKKKYNYRWAKDKDKCSNCDHCKRTIYHNKAYRKCELLGISHGDATDVKAGCVCDNYKKETKC